MKTTTKINPQLVLVSGGIILFSLLFFFGKTVAKKPAPAKDQPVASEEFSISQALTFYKKDLKPYQLDYLARLENAVSRGDVKEQQLHINHQLARFWKDSVQAFLPYAWYSAEAAKLENSEKSLTFAAHLLENRLTEESNPALLNWLAANAKVLFEKALAINPGNDSSKIGLGACYMFGNISDNPMEGILKIREVAERDPGNMYAQRMLVFGGIKSGQYDKAIERMKTILAKEPDNLEMIALLADAYERKGDKENAIAQYHVLESKVTNPDMKKEIRRHAEELKSK